MAKVTRQASLATPEFHTADSSRLVRQPSMGPDRLALSSPGSFQVPVAQSEIFRRSSAEGSVRRKAQVISTEPVAVRGIPVEVRGVEEPTEKPSNFIGPDRLAQTSPGSLQVPVAQTGNIRAAPPSARRGPVELRCLEEEVEVIYSDAFLTKDEFQTIIAKERDTYGASLKRILDTQVEKLQETMSAEVNKMNGRTNKVANAQQADVSKEIRQQVSVITDQATAQVKKRMDENATVLEVLFSEVKKLNARMDEFANAQQTDISSEIRHQLTVRTDPIRAQVEKYANDLKTILQLTEARDEKNAKLESIVGQQQAQIEKNMEAILKMEGALESIANELATTKAMEQVNPLNDIAESCRVQLSKLEAYEQTPATKFEEIFQEIRVLSQNGETLQQQHDYLQGLIDQRGEPVDVNARLIERMVVMEERMLRLSSKEEKNERFECEAHQLFEQLGKNLTAFLPRLQKLEVGGVSVEVNPDLKIKLDNLSSNYDFMHARLKELEKVHGHPPHIAGNLREARGRMSWN